MLLAEPQSPASWGSRDRAVARKLASVSILVSGPGFQRSPSAWGSGSHHVYPLQCGSSGTVTSEQGDEALGRLLESADTSRAPSVPRSRQTRMRPTDPRGDALE